MGNVSTNVLYIAGFGRSGSTLIDRLLNEVDGYCALGEFARFVWTRGLKENQLCGSGDPFRESSFWREVFHRAFGGMEKVNPEEMIYMQRKVSRRRHLVQYISQSFISSNLRDVLPKYIKKMDILCRSISKVSGAKVLGDTSKRPLEGFILSQLPSVKVHVLHLVRDARAVAFSWQRKKRRAEITGKKVYMPQIEPSKTARKWMSRNILVHSFQSKRVAYHRIRYEDMVQAPQECLRDVIRFIGLDKEAPEFGPRNDIELGPNYMISGNPTRFQKGVIQVIPDESWERRMSPLHKRSVEMITLPLMLKYGYVL